MAEENEKYKVCGFCRMNISELALKCRHCGEFVNEEHAAGSLTEKLKQLEQRIRDLEAKND